MSEARHRLGFSEEPLLLCPEVRSEELHGDDPVKLRIDRLVDHAHSALAEDAPEDVPAYPVDELLVVERHGLDDADEGPAVVARVEVGRDLRDVVRRELAVDEGLEARFGRAAHDGVQYIPAVAPESLARLFAEKVGLEGSASDELGRRLAALVERGRAAWPRVVLEPAAFVAHLANHARRSGDPRAYLETVRGRT